MITAKNIEIKVIDHLNEEKKSLFSLSCLIVTEGYRHGRPIEELEDFKKYLEAYNSDWNSYRDKKVSKKENKKDKNLKYSIVDMFKTEEELKLINPENVSKSHENPIIDLEI